MADGRERWRAGLFDPFFHEFSIPLYSGAFGFVEKKEKVFDGFFG
jgi:hypothetical protein